MGGLRRCLFSWIDGCSKISSLCVPEKMVVARDFTETMNMNLGERFAKKKNLLETVSLLCQHKFEKDYTMLNTIGKRKIKLKLCLKFRRFHIL